MHSLDAAREHMVPNGSGGHLHVVEGGRPDGRPVLMHHGTPGAGILYGPHVKDAEAKGIRLIAYDRPGYARSTRQPGLTVAGAADDVRAIADALGIDRLAVWGMSGGGPRALACAALLADRVVAVGTLASPAPYGAPGLDYFAGMGKANVDDIVLTLEDESAAHAKLPEDRAGALALTADTMVARMSSLLSAADAQTQTREFATWIVQGMHTGLEHDGEGWWDDSLAQIRPWGFEVAAIRVPVQLWHGRDDYFVPAGHGEWLAAQIPGVDAHILGGEGHGTVVRRYVPELHAWLLEHF